MPYTKTIPTWNAPGSQPPQSLIDNGWSFNQKPPADYFNWQWHNVYQVLTELHQYALHSEKLAAANGIATLGADSKLTASQLPAIGSAQITDGSITNNDLATDIKVGSLATLGTTAKSTVVAAVNEVRTNLNSHTGDASIHVTPANKTAWDAKAETTTATTLANGLMSSADKTKLDGVAANANNYVHPATHPATMIVEDSTHRFATDTEKATWNAKASTATATTSVNGLMSSADKTKLDSMTSGANNYVHPTGDGNFHVPATGTTSAGKYLKAGATAGSISWETILAGDVSGLQTLLDQKSDTSHGHAAVTTTVAGFMAAADKVKLNGIATGANNYSHPTGDGNLHVPATSTTNNGKVLKAGSTAGSLSWGLIDWTEVTGKPSTFAPSAHSHEITDVTGLQTALDGKSENGHTHAAATTTVAGFMAATDKSKLDGISANANRVTNPATNGVIAIDGVNTTVYAHPTGDGNSHVPATGTTNNGKFLKAGSTAGSFSWQTILAGDVSGLQALLDGKAAASHGHAAATTTVAGFMAAADKSKLDGIAAGAQTNQNAFSNVKVGTTTIAADTATDTLELIAGTNITLTPNATTDAVTITNSTPAATTAVAGLMSAADKSKLDGVATGANNYVHPSTHPATMITEDASHRFATDTEKATWNAKASTAIATTTANGLMSASDKSKLNTVAMDANEVHGNTNNGYIDVNGVLEPVYIHPDTHPATMIVESALRLFMTPTQRDNLAEVYADVYEQPYFVSIPLQNGWVQYATYATPQAAKLPNGVVMLRGWLRDGSDGTIAGTLPAAYRPTKGHTFVCSGTAGTKALYRVNVGSDGAITVNQMSGTANTTLIALDGITFATNS